jgi:hypothetical protein
LTQLTCPDQSKARPPFRCQAVAEGQNFTIAVQLDSDGQLQWQTEGLLQLSRLETILQQEVQQTIGGSVSADCGPVQIRSVQSQETFTCRLRDSAGQERKIRVTVQDQLGNVKFALEQR